MYAVVAIFELDQAAFEGGLGHLTERIVPNVSREPGFVSGYWTHDPAAGRSYNLMIFATQEAAELRAADVRGNATNQAQAGVRPVSIAVTEVVAHAAAAG